MLSHQKKSFNLTLILMSYLDSEECSRLIFQSEGWKCGTNMKFKVKLRKAKNFPYMIELRQESKCQLVQVRSSKDHRTC